MKYFFILLISLLIMSEGCRPPRCPLPNCYVRLKHRHGGENWKAAAAPSDFKPDGNPSANRGKEFRGVPWWQKNKNPKIGEGYEPGYKYNHKKPKPKKRKAKKSKQPEEVIPDTGEEQLIEGEEPLEEEQISEQSTEETVTTEEPKRKKGLFRKKEKKDRQKDAEKPVLEEPQQEKKQDQETDGF
jgi:hypothetical protein